MARKFDKQDWTRFNDVMGNASPGNKMSIVKNLLKDLVSYNNQYSQFASPEKKALNTELESIQADFEQYGDSSYKLFLKEQELRERSGPQPKTTHPERSFDAVAFAAAIRAEVMKELLAMKTPAKDEEIPF